MDNYINNLLFTYLPYIAIAVFAFGLVTRLFKMNKTVHAESTQLLADNKVKLGSNLFHVGIIMVFFGHLTLFIPSWLYHMVMTTETKRMIALTMGTTFGIMALVGMSILVARRFNSPRIKHTSSIQDYFIIILLLIEAAMGLSSVAIGVFMFVALKTDLIENNRVHTWMSRVETFTKKDNQIEDEVDKAKNYQVMQAKAAIVHGGITGIGPGKSALKQMLPQSASDFIFAIIVEEYGLIGAAFLIAMYLIMIFRIVMIASKMPAFFGTLLVISMGIMIFVQIAVNIAVAVNLIPVTGQPLPLISYGGTSMLVTYIQLGLILNVSSRIQIYDEEGMGKKQNVEEINDIA